ncbi:MaoC/PaaZ C-terminal domain-containing protein [Streptomyces sp. WG-D5]
MTTTLHKTVSRVQIAKYAAASGDFNPLHLDDEHARRAGMPGVIAHGMLTLGFVGQAVASLCDDDPERVASLSLRLKKPVLPGDEVVVEIAEEEAQDDLRLLAVTVRRSSDIVAQGRAAIKE